MRKNYGTKFDYLILYEGKARELISVILLATELENRGYTVSIQNSFSHQIKRKQKLDAEVIIVPFLYSDYELYEYVYRVCGENQKIINLRWEQVYSINDECNMDYFGYPKNQAKKVYHMCWSEYLRELLIKSGVDESKAINVGPIQMDVFSDKFRDYFLDRDEMANKYNIDSSKKWNIFISSFSYATLSKKEINSYQENVSNTAAYFADMSIKSKHEILVWIERQLKNGDIWIYRPHPAERDDNDIIELQEKYDNFCVIREEDIKQWLIVVDRVFNWRSTCLADAYFAKKETYILRPIKISDRDETGVMNNVEMIESYEKFAEIFNDIIVKDVYRNVSNYYQKHDKYSYLLISDICEKIYKNELPSCAIDYKKILDSLNKKTKFKNTSLYYCYIAFVIKCSSLSQNNILFKILKNKIRLLNNNIRNIVDKEEIHKIMDRFKEMMCNNKIN
ncbi:MAG: hypothetical protein IJD58_12700 [Lachnospiraceae bacterium]|nr:hypothetical protein [Lachnospiraceae bacterium]